MIGNLLQALRLGHKFTCPRWGQQHGGPCGHPGNGGVLWDPVATPVVQMGTESSLRRCPFREKRVGQLLLWLCILIRALLRTFSILGPPSSSLWPRGCELFEGIVLTSPKVRLLKLTSLKTFPKMFRIPN